MNNDSLVKNAKIPTEEPQEKVKKHVKTFNDLEDSKKPKKAEPKVIYKIGHNYTTSIDKHLEFSSKKDKSAKIPNNSTTEKMDDKAKIVLKSSGKSSN